TPAPQKPDDVLLAIRAWAGWRYRLANRRPPPPDRQTHGAVFQGPLLRGGRIRVLERADPSHGTGAMAAAPCHRRLSRAMHEGRIPDRRPMPSGPGPGRA